MTEPRRKIDDYKYNYRSTSTSTTSSKAHGAGRVPTSSEDYEAIRGAYVSNIGEMTPAAARMIERFIGCGIAPTVICEACGETGLAPQPSAYYLRAILARYAQQGILTMDDLERERAERMRRQAGAMYDKWERWYGER